VITEPSTLFTDYALATLCAALAWRLRAAALATGQRAVRVWTFAFVATALGSLAGGTYHGFQLMLPARVATAVRTLTTLTIGVAACLLLTAALLATIGQRARRWSLLIVWAQFTVYATWMLRHDEFLYVIVEYGLAMLCVLGLMVTRRARAGDAARWIVAGIAVSIAAALIQQSGFDLHRNLNHNDLQHLVQMVAVWLLSRGGLLLRDVPSERLVSW
jgi:uncharacterized protein DUF6962